MFNTNYNTGENFFMKLYGEVRNDFNRLVTGLDIDNNGILLSNETEIQMRTRLLAFGKLSSLVCIGTGLFTLTCAVSAFLSGAALASSIVVGFAAFQVIFGHDMYIIGKNQQKTWEVAGTSLFNGIWNSGVSFFQGKGANFEVNTKIAHLEAICDNTWLKPIWVDIGTFFVKLK